MGIATYAYNRSTSGGEIIRELVNASDGQGLHFDGAAGNIDIASPPDLGTKFSFEFIIQMNAAPAASGWSNIITDFGNGGRFFLGYYAGELIVYSGGAYSTTSLNPLSDSKPHHIVLTIDGTAAKLFDNGSEIGTIPAITSPNIDLCADARIGSGYDGNYSSTITLYRTRFWNKTLSSTEVTATYENATVPFSDQYASTASPLMSGTLTSGKLYRIITYVSGDNFTNLGGTNVTGNEFVATGTTPTTWSNGSSLTQIGCVADYDLAFANPTQSLLVQDRAGAADGTSSATGVKQVTPIEQLNAKALSIGTSVVTPADGEIHAVKAFINSGSSSGSVNITSASDCVAQISSSHASGDAALELANSGDAANTWRVQRAHAGSFEVKDQSAGATRLSISSAGNVTVAGNAVMNGTDNTSGVLTASTYSNYKFQGANTANYGPNIELNTPDGTLLQMCRVGRRDGGTSNDVYIRTGLASALKLGTNNTTSLTISSAGAVTMPTTPAFSAAPSAAQDNLAVAPAVVDIVLGTEIFDQGANFASNTFTAPVAGRYQLNAILGLVNIDSAAAFYQVQIATSNRTYTYTYDPDFGQDAVYWEFGPSVLADMDASDTAVMRFYQSGGTAQTDVASVRTYFNGYLAC
jgi:hypothetical protein